jgi:hypothetical protein
LPLPVLTMMRPRRCPWGFFLAEVLMNESIYVLCRPRERPKIALIGDAYKRAPLRRL